MANYPTLVQLTGTVRESDSGIRILRAVSGRPIFSYWASGNWHVFTVLHEGDSADVASIEDHYDLHRKSNFEFVFDGNNRTYLVQYAEKPKVTPMAGTDRWLIESTLVWTDTYPQKVIFIPVSSTVDCIGESSTKNYDVYVDAVSDVTADGLATGKGVVVALGSGCSVVCEYSAGHTQDVSVDVNVINFIPDKETERFEPATVSVSSSVSATGTNP